MAKSFLMFVPNSFIWKVLLKYNISSSYFSLRIYQTMSNLVSIESKIVFFVCVWL